MFNSGKLRRAAEAAIAVALCVVFGLAQEPDGVFRSNTRLVLLHATVVDRNGKLIADLPRSAFTVKENGVTQELKLFRREDVPVSMGLVIDNSGSMRNKHAQVSAAALAFVKASNPQDETFIVSFNEEHILDPPFTSDIGKLEGALARVVTRGQTAMRDAMQASLDYVKEKGKKDKKVLLVISDGEDNMSLETNTLENLVAKAERSGVLIYCIGLLDEEEPGSARRAKRALEALANSSGGAAYFPKTTDEVSPLALNLAHEIRNQYILAYSPQEQALDGSFRKIQVTAKGPNRPAVRTRPGYYATPDKKAAPPAANSKVP